MTASTIYCNECGAANALQATRCFACDNLLHPFSPPGSIQKQGVPSGSVVAMRTAAGVLAPSFLLHSRYSIVNQVGSGGFGAVYQAKDTLFGNRRVAIKEMSQDGLQPQELAEATAAFEHEALILANLIHPNLPRIHDHFAENGRSYVVMDFIAGETLEVYLSKVVRQLPIEDVLGIGVQLCTVLEYLHRQQPPIIFRDIKPANIMRSADNSIYLIDFGIARHFQPGKAKDTIPLGSKGYAAPEQYGKAQSTPQADIYGLGVTLHELLTGDDPSLTPFHFSYVYIAGSPISAQVNALLKRMVEMEMSKRPATMADVRQELQSLVVRLTAQRPGIALRASQAKLRRRSFLIGLVSVVATCSGSGAITAFIYNKQNDASSLNSTLHALVGNSPASVPATQEPAPADAIIRSRPLYTYRGHNGAVTAVAWSPQGEYIASAGTLDSSVQVWDARTGNIVDASVLETKPNGRKLPSGKGEPDYFDTNSQRVDGLAWASDGTRVAAAFGNDSVSIWDITLGNTIFYRISQPGSGNALAWSPDGAYIASLSGGNYVQVWNAKTGDGLLTYTAHAQAVLALAWSPNGTFIASGGSDGIVRVWDWVTGQTHMTYSDHLGEVNAISWSADSQYIASGGVDNLVQVWDVAMGFTLFTYRGHTDSVNTVAWQRGPHSLVGNEAAIASGGADGTVQVWSLVKKTSYPPAMALQGKVLLYRGHAAAVTSVSWAADGQRIASSSEDGTVQLWRAM